MINVLLHVVLTLLTSPVCKSSPFPADGSCPTAVHLCPSLAWKVWGTKHANLTSFTVFLFPPFCKTFSIHARSERRGLLSEKRHRAALTFSCRWRNRVCQPGRWQRQTGPSSPSPRCSSFPCRWEGGKKKTKPDSWVSNILMLIMRVNKHLGWEDGNHTVKFGCRSPFSLPVSLFVAVKLCKLCSEGFTHAKVQLLGPF